MEMERKREERERGRWGRRGKRRKPAIHSEEKYPLFI